MVRSKAGKKNRKKLEYNHYSGSRSFVATMTIQNSSSSSTPSRVSQDHIGELQKLKAEMEEMKMEREELRRQLEQERREHEEEKKEREEEQKQIAHLTSLVTEFLKEKTQTHKSSIHHDGAMYSTGGTNTR
ncbi:ribosomal biogenesis protein LAS1L-like isoform X3 [Phoenix dactylifera]|nr:ribosomal biogenesis protein LAS1L-like isoform X3 [Phoenix dactylifera]XP_038974400.1 ribosomal biogenesis protein LAS1L-like isoform X3 [Phoenix dactylifera]XP_038975205.1 ribosomal biogenesis protein LAS1L-like isoform X3 [Phoenix dactylifera]XP_038975206.1 ribosomal biogenesis protein LAS1L-like isoform X3 [Phoenix dactylifera]